MHDKTQNINVRKHKDILNRRTDNNKQKKQTITMWCYYQSRGRDYFVLGIVWEKKTVSNSNVNNNNQKKKKKRNKNKTLSHWALLLCHHHPVSLQNRDPKSSFEVPVRAGPLQARWSGPCTHTETETLQDGSWVQQYPCASAQVCFRPQNSPTGSAGGSDVCGSPVSLPFIKNGPQKVL